MQENIKKENGEFFTADELKDLRAALPGKYYKPFVSIWKSKYPKTQAPIRQNVYSVLLGSSENDQIIEVLIKIVEERNKLKKQLKQAIHGSEQEAPAAN